LGIPVVASDLPGSRDGTEGLSGISFVPAGDPAAAAEAIAGVVGDEGLRAELASGALDLRRRLVWPEAAVLRFYRELADEH